MTATPKNIGCANKDIKDIKLFNSNFYLFSKANQIHTYLSSEDK